jgi:hypothetical protein
MSIGAAKMKIALADFFLGKSLFCGLLDGFAETQNVFGFAVEIRLFVDNPLIIAGQAHQKHFWAARTVFDNVG